MDIKVTTREVVDGYIRIEMTQPKQSLNGDLVDIKTELVLYQKEVPEFLSGLLSVLSPYVKVTTEQHITVEFKGR